MENLLSVAQCVRLPVREDSSRFGTPMAVAYLFSKIFQSQYSICSPESTVFMLRKSIKKYQDVTDRSIPFSS